MFYSLFSEVIQIDLVLHIYYFLYFLINVLIYITQEWTLKAIAQPFYIVYVKALSDAKLINLF